MTAWDNISFMLFPFQLVLHDPPPSILLAPPTAPLMHPRRTAIIQQEPAPSTPPLRRSPLTPSPRGQWSVWAPPPPHKAPQLTPPLRGHQQTPPPRGHQTPPPQQTRMLAPPPRRLAMGHRTSLPMARPTPLLRRLPPMDRQRSKVGVTRLMQTLTSPVFCLAFHLLSCRLVAARNQRPLVTAWT